MFSRRTFIKQSASLLALSNLPNWTLPVPRKVALIGTGWYGKSDLLKLMQVAPVEVVGLCDVDRNLLTEAAAIIKARDPREQPALFKDYREMLEKVKPEIVLIGSPDHWHALQAIDSMKAGAHVYVQKPISVDVLEGEAMVAASRKYKRVVQVGTQRRSTPHLIEAKRKYIESGKLGSIHHVELFCYYHMRNNSNPPLQAVPDFLDYDRWTGPAPMRPYDGLPHRGWWRAFMEYSNGIMGDMCIHMFDAARWMLGLGWPEQVSSTGGIYMPNAGKSNIADTQTAVFSYPGLNCVWQHRSWGNAPDPEYPWGYKIYGDKGTLSCSVYQYDFVGTDGRKEHGDAVYEREKYPEDLKEKDIEIHTAPASRSHMRNFLEAIDNGTLPVASIEEGHISTASCILANLSMKLGGRPLRYDPIKKVITGDTEATSLLARPYRLGYSRNDLY